MSLLRRGWVFTFGPVTICHRLRFDYRQGVKGSACRLPPDHPPWLVRGVQNHLGASQRWFRTAEEALTWAAGELALRETKELL